MEDENTPEPIDESKWRPVPHGYIGENGKFIDAEDHLLDKLIRALDGDIGCYNCRHRHGPDETGTCDAYPEGIPIAFITGQIPHTKAEPGDNGIQWEPIEKKKD